MMRQSRWRTARLLLALLVLPLLIHHDAGRGFFEDDDFDTLTWARYVPLASYIRDIPDIRYSNDHRRPAGYLFYGLLVRAVGLEYASWTLVLQVIGLVNAALLWLLLRKIGLNPLPAAAGCLFFIASRTLFDGWWKPMFVFDVLCATFSLAAILLYAHRRWVLAFFAFWLAVRVKEVAVVLPVVLLLYEFTIGGRKWKRLIPFFLPALVHGGFGLQASLSLEPGTAYAMSFSPAALWKSIAFYEAKFFWLPWSGVLLLLPASLIRDRRVWFGLGAALLQLAAYLFLPERLLEAYMYLAMTGAAIVVALCAAHYPRIVALLAILWLPWQIYQIRLNAASALSQARHRADYFNALRRAPDAPVYVYSGAPPSLRIWGVAGALRLLHKDVAEVQSYEDAAPPPGKPATLLIWDPAARKLSSRPFDPAELSFHDRGRQPAPGQLLAGAARDERGYQAIREKGFGRIFRPDGAEAFGIEACGEEGAHLLIFLADEELPKIEFRTAGCVTRQYPLPPGPAGTRTLFLLPRPHEKTMRIGNFGFRPRRSRDHAGGGRKEP
jgi:hypothetical protein